MTIDIDPVERDARSAPFFDAAAEGRLLIKVCHSCGHLYPPDLATCPACCSDDAGWQASTGEGTVISFVVTHRKGPDGPRRTAVALVELAEGPWMTLPADVGDGELQGGQPVRVGFHRVEGSETVPVWRPVGADA